MACTRWARRPLRAAGTPCAPSPRRWRDHMPERDRGAGGRRGAGAAAAGAERPAIARPEIDGYLRVPRDRRYPAGAAGGSSAGPGGDLLRRRTSCPRGGIRFDRSGCRCLRRGRRRLQAERLIARHARTATGSRNRSHWCCGRRQPEDRRRPHRPGAGLIGPAALRQLRPAPAPAVDLGNGPAAHRRGDDAVRHLPGYLPLQTRVGRGGVPGGKRRQPPERNFVRHNTLRHQAEKGCDFETAALRVFQRRRRLRVQRQPPDRRQPVERRGRPGRMFTQRKCFARPFRRARAPAGLLKTMLGGWTWPQNLESVEVGVTTIDHYFDLAGRHHPRGGPGRARRCRSISATRRSGDRSHAGRAGRLETRTRC